MTDEARFLKKSFGVPNFSLVRLNQAQNHFFCHFLEFGLDVFQFPTSIGGKTHEKFWGLKFGSNGPKSCSKLLKKIFGLKFGPNGPKSDPQLGFSPFSQV